MDDSPHAPVAPRWRPLERNERRVAGVLAEKAKTTPENYPLTLNSLVNGCNQKSNRFPQMQLDEDQVSQALDALRHSGAVALIQGDGRAEKYRHLLYEWLGVDKAELAVMTELLLRGAQTMGELRGRAARMEPIRDMNELVPIVDRLREKGLVIFFSSPGRGAVVTHNLYQPQELAKVRTEHGSEAGDAGSSDESRIRGSAMPAPVAGAGSARTASPVAALAPPAAPAAERDITDLRQELADVKRQLADVGERADAAVAELRREFEDLKRQLGA